MDRQTILEAALFCAPQPLTVEGIQRLFEGNDAPSKSETKDWLQTLQTQYQDQGIHLVEVASGWRFQINPQCTPHLQSLFEEKPQKYSRALLETLALVAYRQPITRAEIEDVRGIVVSTNMMKTLLEHQWVRIVGHREVPGKPALYATTREFLDYFNLKSLEALPPLSEVLEIGQAAAEQMELMLSQTAFSEKIWAAAPKTQHNDNTVVGSDVSESSPLQ